MGSSSSHTSTAADYSRGMSYGIPAWHPRDSGAAQPTGSRADTRGSGPITITYSTWDASRTAARRSSATVTTSTSDVPVVGGDYGR